MFCWGEAAMPRAAVGSFQSLGQERGFLRIVPCASWRVMQPHFQSMHQPQLSPPPWVLPCKCNSGSIGLIRFCLVGPQKWAQDWIRPQLGTREDEGGLSPTKLVQHPLHYRKPRRHSYPMQTALKPRVLKKKLIHLYISISQNRKWLPLPTKKLKTKMPSHYLSTHRPIFAAFISCAPGKKTFLGNYSNCFILFELC